MKSQLQGWAGLLREWFLDACWQLFLTAPRQVAVDAPENRLALGLALVAGAVLEQAKAVTRVQRDVGPDEGDDPGFVTRRGLLAQR